ncbi:MAG TPA: hypothetical protein VI942_00780 [Thermoanaerobaculia bacterium]|nr:hypothetical protein [Thermoanaerobaculia bacterium]
MKLVKWATISATVAVAAALFSSAPAVAHEGHHHQAMGTVKSIEAAKLVLEKADGAEQTFVLSDSTRYLRGESEAKRNDVAAGERAVVMYESKDGADRALEVKLGEKKP